MKRKNIVILGLIGIPIAIVFGLILTAPSENTGREEVYHVRLADPKQYQDGIFIDDFFASKGTYEFRFVPNGDSPQILSITLEGPTFSFSEDFELEGTEQGYIGKYYTWKYLGQDQIEIPDEQELQITVNPHGEIMGPVSVYLIK